MANYFSKLFILVFLADLYQYVKLQVKMENKETAVVALQQLPLEAREMFQTMAAIELYRAQREVANYLELAYLKLSDHPDVARDVRLTAHSARTQHIMTSGLMKKFAVSAAHIVRTMIPMIIDAIELQDKDIIVDCFGQILDIAENMKKEAEETKENYLTIQLQVQNNLAKVTARNKHVIDEHERRALELQREKDLIRASELKQKQLEEEKKKMVEELKTLKQYRKEMKNEAVHALHQKTERGANDESFLDRAIGAGKALGGGMDVIFGVVEVGVNLFKSIFGGKKENQKIKITQEAFAKSQENVEKMFEKNKDILERIHQERKEALLRLATIRELALAEVGLGNAESLREASAHLGDVDKQITRMIQFWSNLAAVLKFLRDDTKAGEVYLKKIENPGYANRFNASVSRAEQGWQNFGRICADYVQESDFEIEKLYAFLSAPIEQMSAEQRKERLHELLQCIENDIHNAFPIQ